MILNVPRWYAYPEFATMEVAALVLIGSVAAWFVEEISKDTF